MKSSELVSFLKDINIGEGFLEQLKINYRPLICPFHLLIPLVKPGDVVLDIGCGSGQFALLLSEFSQPKKIYGIEVDSRLVENANKLFKSLNSASIAEFHNYDGEIFPPAVRNSNLVFMIDVLHHIKAEHHEVFFKNLFDMMPKGGQFVLKDIDKSSPLVFFNKIHDLIFAREIGNEVSVYVAIHLLKKAGFKIISSQKARMYVYPHYVIVVEK